MLEKDLATPTITKGEIEDHSKGDGLTKAIVVLQTTWFLEQGIVQWSSRLLVTKLGVLTLGFTMLDGITYALWRHKPQGVRPPVYLEREASTTGEQCVMKEDSRNHVLNAPSSNLMEVAPEPEESRWACVRATQKLGDKRGE